MITENNKLAEDYQKISIDSLLREIKPQIKQELLQSKLELNNTPVELTESNTCFGGTRLWFKCPICSKKVGNIYKGDVIGCRKCLNLKYRGSRYKGMIEE